MQFLLFSLILFSDQLKFAVCNKVYFRKKNYLCASAKKDATFLLNK